MPITHHGLIHRAHVTIECRGNRDLDRDGKNDHANQNDHEIGKK